VRHDAGFQRTRGPLSSLQRQRQHLQHCYGSFRHARPRAGLQRHPFDPSWGHEYSFARSGTLGQLLGSSQHLRPLLFERPLDHKLPQYHRVRRLQISLRATATRDPRPRHGFLFGTHQPDSLRCRKLVSSISYRAVPPSCRLDVNPTTQRRGGLRVQSSDQHSARLRNGKLRLDVRPVLSLQSNVWRRLCCDQIKTILEILLAGVQYRNVSCVGRQTLEQAERSLCDANNEPAATQRCAEIPCDAQWVPYPWGNCSEPCGEGGVQTREIACQQIISNGYPSLVDDEECAKLHPKPPQKQVCNKGRICAKWHTGPWKPVSPILFLSRLY
jgi:hypothetical protein